MNKLLVLTLIFLIPSATAEMSHSPNEVAEGDTFTAIIDVDDDVKEVTV